MLAGAPLDELQRGATHLDEPKEYYNRHEDTDDLSEPGPRPAAVVRPPGCHES